MFKYISADDIAVVFYEIDESGKRSWEGQGLFAPTDVHRQVFLN